MPAPSPYPLPRGEGEPYGSLPPCGGGLGRGGGATFAALILFLALTLPARAQDAFLTALPGLAASFSMCTSSRAPRE